MGAACCVAWCVLRLCTTPVSSGHCQAVHSRSQPCAPVASLPCPAAPPAASLPPCRRAYFQQRFEQLQTELLVPNPAAFDPAVFTLDAFLWAACTVRARSHPPLDGRDIALVPLADMVRPSPACSCLPACLPVHGCHLLA